jgi:hypothetical protein
MGIQTVAATRLPSVREPGLFRFVKSNRLNR